MYNLLKFISKYHLSFLFLFLELIAFGLIVQNNNYHKAGFLNSANTLTGGVNSLYSSFTIYLDLKNENKKLAEENAQLKNQLHTIEYTLIPPFEKDTSNSVLDTLVLDTLVQYKYIPALTLSNSTNRKFNYLYLNKGKNDGVHNDMGVMEPNGVVGVVVNSTAHYSIVMPLINEKSSLSVKIKNQGYFGTLKWGQGDPKHATIIEVPNHVILNQGDTIITSGYSQIFPQGKLIGFVQNANKTEGNSFLEIQVELAVDFSKINYSYILNNSEIKELKEIIIE